MTKSFLYGFFILFLIVSCKNHHPCEKFVIKMMGTKGDSLDFYFEAHQNIVESYESEVLKGVAPSVFFGNRLKLINYKIKKVNEFPPKYYVEYIDENGKSLSDIILIDKSALKEVVFTFENDDKGCKLYFVKILNLSVTTTSVKRR